MTSGDLVQTINAVEIPSGTIAAGTILAIKDVLPQAHGDRPGFGIDLLNLVDSNDRMLVSCLSADRVRKL